jgi:hypothetical protein
LDKDKYATWSTIVSCEKEMLTQLDWNMNVLGPLYFVRFMSAFGVVFEGDKLDHGQPTAELAKKVTKYVTVFIDLSTYYPAIQMQYSDLELAIACVICS